MFERSPGERTARWKRCSVMRAPEFWVELPLHTLPPRHGGDLHARLLDSSNLANAVRARSLYVEDNPENVIFMEDLLDVFEGIELTVARNAEVGIELAMATLPHVIIMDINVPGMSASTHCRCCRIFRQPAAPR